MCHFYVCKFLMTAKKCNIVEFYSHEKKMCKVYNRLSFDSAECS